MQHVEQKKSETRALTDAELETISGGSLFSDIIKMVQDLRLPPPKKK